MLTNELLRLAEAPLVCRKCREVKWQRLSQPIECCACLQSVVASSEKISEARGNVTGSYRCDCGNSWSATRHIERPCANADCSGRMRLLMEEELTATPIAADCCGTICWELSGTIGSDVQCRHCTKHTPATRRIGINHVALLTALFKAKARIPFAVISAQVGPIVFCSALPARDHPRTRGLPSNCRVETSKPATTANLYDALMAASGTD